MDRHGFHIASSTLFPSTLKRRARRLRHEASPAERRLWQALRSNPAIGCKVRRQVPCGSCILDFLIPEARLVIELDGQSHDSDDGQSSDMRRDAWLASHGFRVLRFANADVLLNLEGVVGAVAAAVAAGRACRHAEHRQGKPAPSPSGRGPG